MPNVEQNQHEGFITNVLGLPLNVRQFTLYCHKYPCIAKLHEHTFWNAIFCKLTSEHNDFEIHEYKIRVFLFVINIKIWPCSHAAKTKPIDRMRIRLLRVNWPLGHKYNTHLHQPTLIFFAALPFLLLYDATLVWKALKSRVILTAHSRNVMKCLNDAKELGSATGNCGNVKYISNYKKGFDLLSFTSGIKMNHFLIATNEPTTYLCDFSSTDRDSHKLKAYSPQYFP